MLSTGLPSSVGVVWWALKVGQGISVYQTSKTKGKIWDFKTDDSKLLLPCYFFCVYFGDLRSDRYFDQKKKTKKKTRLREL